MKKVKEYPSDFGMDVAQIILNKEAGWSLELEKSINKYTNGIIQMFQDYADKNEDENVRLAVEEIKKLLNK